MKILLTITTLLLTSNLLLAAPRISNRAIADGLNGGGWNKKRGTATEYRSADSNYRTYKPTVSPTPDGGLFVSTKINHIRGGFWFVGAGDDRCILEMTFDANAKLSSTKAVVRMGNKKFDTDIITSATRDQRARVAAKVFNKLANQISRWTNDGGRENFPAVVKHNINVIASAVKP